MIKALPNLKGSLDRVRAIADDVDAHVQDALKDADVQERHETTLCAATVILSGFLESFLREAAEEMISDICGRTIPFDHLPSQVRITHFLDGAVHLRNLAGEEKSSNPLILAQASDTASRLSSVSGPQMPYEIVWEAFANTQANPGSKELGTYLKRFHIFEPIRTLAATMKTSENALALRLNSFMEIRNECAHTGRAKNNPTPSDVRGYCDLIQSIGEGVVGVFRNVLAGPPYAAVAPGTVPQPPAQQP